jgi:serine/threonine-protein kinase
MSESATSNPNAPTESRAEPRANPAAPTLSADGAPPDATRPLPSIPGLRVLRLLGGGGMGEVYEVVDDKLGVTYALKMIRPDRVGTRFLVRFKHEARTMVDLDHPNIARIYAYDELDGCPYFTMKYLPDGTLGDRLEKLRDRPRAAIAVVAKVARAVHYLHTKGFVHRDLKPQNILFAGDEPFVSDFGLAKAQGDADEEIAYSPNRTGPDTYRDAAHADTKDLNSGAPWPQSQLPLATATGGIVGTLPYMSPEQVLGQRAKITAKTDLWALGVLLYEMLCGHRPFDSEDKSVLSELIKKADVQPPMAGNAPIDPALRRVIDRCLAKVPADRYESAAQLADDLDRWLHPPRPIRIWRRAVALIGIAALVIAVVFVLTRKDEPPQKTPEKTPALTPAPLISAVPVDDFAGRLLNGLPAEALGPLGKPAYLRWRVGQDDGSLSQWYTDKAFTVTTGTMALLELLEKTPVERFLFEVEVRVNDIDPQAYAGLYVGHQTCPTIKGEGHFFVSFSFSEARTQPADFSRHDVRFWYHVRPANDRPSSSPLEVMNLVDYFHNPDPSPNRPWRKLGVKVTPDSFEFLWDGNTFRTVPRAIPPHRIAALNKFAGAAAPLPINFKKYSAFGLFVAGGSASFQNAKITALKP